MFTLNIVTDNCPESPRDGINLGTIYYSSSHYTLGDKCVSKDHINDLMNDKNVVYLPVFAYIHSGILLNTSGFSCPWDSGMSGIIAVTKNEIRTQFNVKRITKSILDKVLTCLKGEVETYSKYLNGEVYGYEILNEKNEVVDSCFGFYSEEDAQSEGESSLKFFQNKAA